MKKLLFTLCVSSLIATANAATITVTSTADNTTADGQCTLREAIAVANTNAATADCPLTGDSSTTDDNIVFDTTGNQIDLSEGLLTVTDVLTIKATEDAPMILDGGKDTPSAGTNTQTIRVAIQSPTATKSA